MIVGCRIYPCMNLILAILLSVVSCFSLFNSFGLDALPAPELTEFNTGLARQFVILIENTDDGLIKVLTDAEEKVIGEVVLPVQRASSIPSRYWGAHSDSRASCFRVDVFCRGSSGLTNWGPQRFPQRRRQFIGQRYGANSFFHP